MSLVGNDVVDLGDPAIASSHQRERFLARVLCQSEREALEGAPDAKAFVWARFAAKEAAFKVLSKDHRSAPPLAHRRFEVAADLSSVRHGEVTLDLEVEVDQAFAFVHAVAWTGLERPRWRVERIAEGADPSASVRRLLLAALGGGADLEVVRAPVPGSWDGFGPPRVLRGGVPIEVDVSLSHDGRYVAWAMANAGRDVRVPS